MLGFLQYMLVWSLNVTCFGGFSNFFPTKISSCLTDVVLVGSQNLTLSSGDVRPASHFIFLPFFFTFIGPRFSKKDLTVMVEIEREVTFDFLSSLID